MDESLSEDVVHTVLIRLIEKEGRQLDDDRDIYGYLYVSIENELSTACRKLRTTRSLDAPVLGDSDTDQDSGLVLGDKIDSLRCELTLSFDSTCLGKAYAALVSEPATSGRVRDAEVLDYLALADSYPTSKDLAAFFGTAEGAARERKSQVLKRLRRKCLELCGDDTCRE